MKKWLSCVLVLVFLFSTNVFALTTTTRLYNAYDIDSTTYVYNGSGGTAATDGQENVTDAQRVTIMVGVTTLVSTSVTIVIEGRNADYTNWASVFEKTYTAAHTATTYDPILVTEAFSFLRVGLKVTGDAGTDAVTVYLIEDRR